MDKLVARGGCVMVCGGTAMGIAVQAAIVRAKAKAASGSEAAEAEAAAAVWMGGLVTAGKYVQELWS